MQTRREVERRGRSAYFTASQPELQSCALFRRLQRPFQQRRSEKSFLRPLVSV